MGFRFRKILGLAPGIKLNLSKSGGSLSFGKRGATINLGPKGARSTVGLPGSGLSYSSYASHNGRGRLTVFIIVALLVVVILVVTR